MNYKIKAALRQWEISQRYQMPQGGKMTLSFIIEEERNRAGNNPTEYAMPEFLDTIHPCLYPLFVINWKKVQTKRIPTKFKGDSIMFLRDVMDEWFKECGKKNYFIDGMFTSFHDVGEVEDAIKHFTNQNLQYLNEKGEISIDYVEMEYRMGERQAEMVKQQQLADKKAIEQQKLEEKARRKQEEAERKAAKSAAAKQPSATPPTLTSIDDLMYEAQSLFDKSPLPKCVLQIYVRPSDADEPYTAELVWEQTDTAPLRSSDIFTGNSFSAVISKAKTHVSGLIDNLINAKQKEKQRRDIQQQIDDQNVAFQKQMEENQRMLQQMQQLMSEQQRKHEEHVAFLHQKMESL